MLQLSTTNLSVCYGIDDPIAQWFSTKELPFLRMGIPKSPLVSIQSHGLKSNDLGVILGVPP